MRDGAAVEAYRRPGDLIDSQHPKITAYARRVAGEGSDHEKALRLYYAVRDDLRYDPYNTPMKREAYRASTTLAAGHGFCVNKAGLMAAVCRAVGIPARVGYADVRNHMTTKRLSDLMGSDIFFYHGYTDVWRGLLLAKALPTAVFTVVFFLLILGNLIIADRLQPRFRPAGPEEELVERGHGDVQHSARSGRKTTGDLQRDPWQDSFLSQNES